MPRWVRDKAPTLRPRQCQCAALFFNKEELTWNHCFSLCTDGAPAMFGTPKAFFRSRVLIRSEIFHVSLTEGCWKTWIKEVTQVVSFTKTRRKTRRRLTRCGQIPEPNACVNFITLRSGDCHG